VQRNKSLGNAEHTLRLFSFCDQALEKGGRLVKKVTCWNDNHRNRVQLHGFQCDGSDPADSFHARLYSANITPNHMANHKQRMYVFICFFYVPLRSSAAQQGIVLPFVDAVFHVFKGHNALLNGLCRFELDQ